MRFFSLFILTILSSHCIGQIPKEGQPFKKGIPVSINGPTSLLYKLIQQRVKYLGIEDLQSGYDSLQIRLWYEYSFTNERKLIVIKRNDSKWQLDGYKLMVEWNSATQTEMVSGTKISGLEPKNGFNYFISALNALKVTELDNMKDIPGLYDSWTDGYGCTIEVATPKHYRFYSYHVPDKFQEKYWQAKNIINIFKLIESELGTNWSL